jgi:hypothetical protein
MTKKRQGKTYLYILERLERNRNKANMKGYIGSFGLVL